MLLKLTDYSRSYSTRNSAIADKPRDAFRRSVKVIKHGTIHYDRYSFLLVFYSNFVPKPVYQTADFKYTVTLKTGLWVRQYH